MMELPGPVLILLATKPNQSGRLLHQTSLCSTSHHLLQGNTHIKEIYGCTVTIKIINKSNNQYMLNGKGVLIWKKANGKWRKCWHQNAIILLPKASPRYIFLSSYHMASPLVNRESYRDRR